MDTDSVSVNDWFGSIAISIYIILPAKENILCEVLENDLVFLILKAQKSNKWMKEDKDHINHKFENLMFSLVFYGAK